MLLGDERDYRVLLLKLRLKSRYSLLLLLLFLLLLGSLSAISPITSARATVFKGDAQVLESLALPHVEQAGLDLVLLAQI